MEELNTPDFTDDNTIIYGHNMKNGSRFHDIRYFTDKDFFESHQKIYIYIPDGTVNVYNIFCSKIIKPNDGLYSVHVYNYADFINSCLNNVKYSSYIDGNEKRRLLTLSTCNSSTNKKRNVVIAYLERNYKQ